MVSKAEINDLVAACKDGYCLETDSYGFGYFLQHVLCSVGRMVECYEAGRRSDMKTYDYLLPVRPKNFCYSALVHNTFEDGMAKAAIRVFTLCGYYGISPITDGDTFNDSYMEYFKRMMGSYDVVECCFVLSQLLCRCDETMLDDDTESGVPMLIGAAIVLLFGMAKGMDIDLVRHIAMRMDFDDSSNRYEGRGI